MHSKSNVIQQIFQKRKKLFLLFLYSTPFWITSIIIGVISVGYAKLFAYAERLAHQLFAYQPLYIFVWAPLLFLIATVIVKKAAPYARGSGIPQVMAAIELSKTENRSLIDKLLSIKIVIVKIISSVLMVLGGGAVGREGPTIQIASSIFKSVNRLLPKNWPKVSEVTMIITGAAAGLAAAFNTPLGGIVFSIEELSKSHISRYRTQLFTAIIIAGLTAQYYLGSYLYIGYPEAGSDNFSVFLLLLLVAFLSSILANFMSKSILLFFSWKKKLPEFVATYLLPVFLGLTFAVLVYYFGVSMMGSGKELINDSLFSQGKDMHWYTPLLRTIGPVLSFSTEAAAGIFAPSLSAGASVGAVVADFFQIYQKEANVLILGGMVAFLTGVTRSPFTSAILVFEMTNSHELIFYLLFAAMVSNVISFAFDRYSFYDRIKHRITDELSEAETK